MSDPTQMTQLRALILPISIKTETLPKFLLDMGNNMVQNLTKISRVVSRPDYQNEAASKKLVIVGLFLFPFDITVLNPQSFFTVGGEQREIISG